MLVTSSRNTDKWIVPGGGLEPDEDSDKAAVREVMEEAGVRGVLGRFLGTFEVLQEAHTGLSGHWPTRVLTSVPSLDVPSSRTWSGNTGHQCTFWSSPRSSMSGKTLPP